MQLRILTRVAFGVGVTGAIGLYVGYELTQSRISDKPYYKEALQLMNQYEPLKVHYFKNAEVRAGSVNLSDVKQNKISPTSAQLCVPVIARNGRRAKLYLYAAKYGSDETSWRVNKLDVELFERKPPLRWTFYELPESEANSSSEVAPPGDLAASDSSSTKSDPAPLEFLYTEAAKRKK